MHLCKYFPTFVLTLLLSYPATGFSQSQLIRFDSNLGKFDVLLTDNTPLTNANFLAYADAGDYDNTFMHRLVPGFIIQAGGFSLADNLVGEVNRNDPVQNEPFNSNVRGTIAMAKLGGDPDSATNQWFFNLENNSENLDNQNGGFTAFGNVTADGMDVVDLLASTPVFDASAGLNPFFGLPVVNPNPPFGSFGPFTTLPLLGPVVTQGNFLIFSRITRTANALGDLDGSGAISGPDIDLLYAAYGAAPANDIELDLDSDGEVGDLDRDRLIERIAGTRLGDLNFDGSVDVSGDAFAMVGNLGTTSGAAYAQGDINGDGAVDVLGDAFILVGNLGFTAAGSP